MNINHEFMREILQLIPVMELIPSLSMKVYSEIVLSVMKVIV